MQKWTRRRWVTTAGLGIGAGAMTGHSTESNPSLFSEISNIPNLSGHEHWGSISSIGWSESGFLADLKAGIEPSRTTLLDILIDPYSGLVFGPKGVDLSAEARNQGVSTPQEWFQNDPSSAWQAVRRSFDGITSTGWFSCLEKGFRSLYQTSLHELLHLPSNSIEPVLQLDRLVSRRYTNLMSWYDQACDLLRIEKILRPVQLEYGYRHESEGEGKRMAPLLRIDSFCSFYQKPTDSMRFCIEKTGIEPRSADEFREFLSTCFTLAEQAGFKGTKQLQAYSRSLNFIRPNDSEVVFEKTADREKQLRFCDFVVYECLEQTAKRHWPHQIHVGTHNLPDSNPLPLQTLIHAFPQIDFVLLHAWPYIDDSAYLARSFPNVYIDPCWTPILNLQYFRSSLETYIGSLPDTKVMIGHDSTSVEMAAGSLGFCRKILAEILQKRMDCDDLPYESALSLARRYLLENAKRIYRA